VLVQSIRADCGIRGDTSVTHIGVFTLLCVTFKYLPRPSLLESTLYSSEETDVGRSSAEIIGPFSLVGEGFDAGAGGFAAILMLCTRYISHNGRSNSRVEHTCIAT
jgi:hypothetical protein